MIVVVVSWLVVGCAELVEFRADIARLRSDLQANAQSLSQMAARVDELERRQAEAESAARRTQQDLSQAIEVLLRKALITEDRQITREADKHWHQGPTNPESQPRLDSATGQGSTAEGVNWQPGRKQLSLGMSRDDVRHLLGEPLSIEPVGSYVFWHYSPLRNHQYIIFDTMSGQVSGWRDP
jgi:hypothetical protein